MRERQALHRGGRPRARARCTCSVDQGPAWSLPRLSPRRRTGVACSRSHDPVRRSRRAPPGDQALELVKIDLGDGDPVSQSPPEAHLQGSLEAPEKDPQVWERMFAFGLGDAHRFPRASLGPPVDRMWKAARIGRKVRPNSSRIAVEESPCGKGKWGKAECDGHGRTEEARKRRICFLATPVEAALRARPSRRRRHGRGARK
jgi:hypothetical protein